MKITSTPPIAPVDNAVDTGSAAAGRSAPERSAAPATKVSLSRDANFVDQLREKATEAPFRADVVAEVKAQLAAGTFEASVDMDKTVDGLLAGL